MKYYAVIDTNVLVSAQLKPSSIPGLILKEALVGEIIPLLHRDILTEYSNVLRRKKFHFDENVIETFMEQFSKRGIFVDAAEISDYVRDPKDVIFYQVVMEGRKKQERTYLVTGNICDFPSRVYVVTPKEMLEIISKK